MGSVADGKRRQGETSLAQGELSCYLAEPDLVAALREACQSLGVDVDRRGRHDVPNPAAHRGGVVFLDVPPGQERRLEWCKRLKRIDGSIRVVLAIHEPSKARVARALLAEPDAIVGLPATAEQIAAKLGPLLGGEDGAPSARPAGP